MSKFLSTDPKTCAMCGKTYQPTSNRQKYCVECQGVKHKERCKSYHKKTYERRGYDQKGEKNNAYKSGIGAYKEKALAFYGKRCTECGSKEHICVHHKDENRKNNDITNLEVLCRSCHAKRHELHKNFGGF